MNAKTIMVTPVITVKPDTPMRDVVTLFARHRISGVPVVNDANDLVGIVTDGDVMKYIQKREPLYVDTLMMVMVLQDSEELRNKVLRLLRLPVQEVMTRKVIAVPEDYGVADIARILSSRKIKKVPVVRGKTLVGIISRGDVIRAIVRQMLTQE
jgi:CBS domain-containing protein